MNVVLGSSFFHSDVNMYGSNGMEIFSLSLSMLVAMNGVVTASS